MLEPPSRFWSPLAGGVSDQPTTYRPLGYEILNLGRGEPVLLADFVQSIEKLTGRKANLTPAPPPDTDMLSAHADTTKAAQLLDYRPTVSVGEGVQRFLNWYERAVRHPPDEAGS